MKNIHILVFFALLLFLFPSVTFAQWTKYTSNPVLSPTDNTWDSQITRCPSVLKDGASYKMWYMGYNGTDWGIGFALSSDGIIWQKNQNPLITKASYGLSNSQGTVEPTVIKIADTYHMWFHELTTEGLGNRIRYATSTDGVTWDIYPYPVLEGSSNTWENSGPTDPFVYFENSTFHMWYMATGPGSPWKIGYATSADGIHWQKYFGNPLDLPVNHHAGAMSLLKLNDKYHLWYHTSGAIYHTVSTDLHSWQCEENCSVLQMDTDTFDSQSITCPSVIEDNSQLKMWYSGFNGNQWQIGLATAGLSAPSPSPTPKIPVILIPGFMSSWNKDAILHNQSVSTDDWIPSPFIKEYKGITQSLVNIGYQENIDYFVFYYDWRKKVDSITNDLNDYLQQKIWSSTPDRKINIIGHSLGGIVGKVWAQKNGIDKLNKLITVGSPHKGTAVVYKALEGGEIDRQDFYIWLAEKIILLLNKNTLESDKDTINRRLPVLKDISPVYPFLKKKDNTFVPIDFMHVKNDLLNSFNANEPSLYPVLQTIIGEKGNDSTVFGFSVIDRTILDKLLNLYTDGRPDDSLFDKGDFIILSSSAKAGNDIKILSEDHGEIIYRKDAIKTIFDGLQLPYSDSQITEGSKTITAPSLIFLLKSPAVMEVTNNGNTYLENEGLVFIEDMQTGNFNLKISGRNQGHYTVLIGQLGLNNAIWQTIEGEIGTLPQDDFYQLSINANNPEQIILPISQLFNELTVYLTDLNRTLKNVDLNKCIINLNKAKQYFIQNNKGRLKSTLFTIHQQLFTAIRTLNKNDVQSLLLAIDKLEILFENSLGNYNFGQNSLKFKKNFAGYKQNLTSSMNYLLQQQQKGIMIDKNARIIQLIEDNLREAETALLNKQILKVEILLKTVEELAKDVRKK